MFTKKNFVSGNHSRGLSSLENVYGNRGRWGNRSALAAATLQPNGIGEKKILTAKITRGKKFP